MVIEEEADESTAAFLAHLGDYLFKQKNIDTDLVSILQTHLLTVSPSQDAVAKANAAIVQLAGVRANPPKTEGINA